MKMVARKKYTEWTSQECECTLHAGTQNLTGKEWEFSPTILLQFFSRSMHVVVVSFGRARRPDPRWSGCNTTHKRANKENFIRSTLIFFDAQLALAGSSALRVQHTFCIKIVRILDKNENSLNCRPRELWPFFADVHVVQALLFEFRAVLIR